VTASPAAGDAGARLRHALGAVRILWPGAFSFAGRVFPGPAATLVERLKTELYLGCYCQSLPAAGDVPPGAAPEDTAAEREELLQLLAAANASRERRLTGWRVLARLPDGRLAARRHDAVFTFPAGGLIDSGGGAPAPGAACDLLLPRESRRLDEEFYFAFGETPGLQEDGGAIVRLYWNVGREGAPRLFAVLTRRLNRFRLPFQLKCANRPRQLARLDAAVLFVARRHYRAVAEVLAGSYPDLEPLLGPETPLFTKRLAPGLGLAEEPGGESFGSGRCRLVAEGIWRAWLQGAEDLEPRLAAVAAEFRRAGLDLERPYLNPGAPDAYSFPLPEAP
jgi:type III HopA1-like effector protein